MTTKALNLTLLHDGVASQRVTLPQDKPFYLKAVPGNRYFIGQGEDAASPEKITVTRKGKNLEIRAAGDEQPQLVILNYYDHPGDVMGVDADGELHEYINAADASEEADEIDDDRTAVMVMSRSSSGPIAAYYPAGNFGFLKAAAAFAGLLALGGGILAMQNQHGNDGGHSLPAPVITRGIGNATGALHSGATTNDATPEISGTGSVPGNLIQIYSNGLVLGSALVDADGNWTLTLPNLPEGMNSLTAIESDAAGLVSPASAQFEINVDVTPPPVTLAGVDDAVGTVVGNIASGGVTNDNTPLLNGKSEPGAIINVMIDGVLVGSVSADAAGDWSFRTATLPDGEYSLTVTASDALGNISEPSPPYLITIDTVAPDATITAVFDNVAGGVQDGVDIGNNGLTNDSQPVLQGSAEAGSLVVIYDGTTALASFTATTTTWELKLPAPLVNGEHRLSISVTDVAGNSSTSAPFVITVDTLAPASSITATLDNVAGGIQDGGIVASGGLTNDNRPVLQGTAEAGSVVVIYDGTTVIGSFTATTARWEYPLTDALADGAHTLTINVTDAAGNRHTSAPYLINVDTVAPAASITAALDNVAGGIQDGGTIASGGITNDNQPVLRGTAEAGSLVVIYDGTTVIGSFTATGATWEYPLTAALPEGQRSLTISVTDAAGNSSTSSPYVVNVDTSSPVASITAALDNVAGGIQDGGTVASGGITNDNQPVLRGTAEAGSLVVIYDGTTVIGSFTATDASWEYPLTGTLTDGAHTLTVSVTNTAGTTTTSAPYVINVDTVAPAASIIAALDNVAGGIQDGGTIASGGSTNDNQPVLRGTAEAGSLVVIYDGTTVIGSFTATNAAWEYPLTAALPEGQHLLTISVTDAAGNSSTSAPFVINVDTLAPEASAVVSSIAKDSGFSSSDYLTNDGSAGRLVKGTLTSALAVGEIVQVSFDEGVNWIAAAINADGTWYALDNLAHSSSWSIQTRVVDAAGNISTASQNVTLDTTPPDAPAAIVRQGNQVTVDITGSGAQAGDVLKVTLGNQVIDHVLTQTEIDAFNVQLSFPTWDVSDSYSAALIDPAGNISEVRQRDPNYSTTNLEGLTPTPTTRAGQTLDIGLFDFTFAASNTYSGIKGPNTPIEGAGTTSSTVLSVYAQAGLMNTLTLKGTNVANYVKFDYIDLENTLTLRFYDINGLEVHTATLAAGANLSNRTFALELPDNIYFHSIGFDWPAGDGILLDNFTFGNQQLDIQQDVAPALQQAITGSIETLYGGEENNIFEVEDVSGLSSMKHIAGNGGIDTLLISGENQQLDFSLISKKIQSVEQIDLTGKGNGNNSLLLSVEDVLTHGDTDLFHTVGTSQMLVKGTIGDTVTLSDLMDSGDDKGDWQQTSSLTLDGINYNVYQHSGLTAEALIQEGLNVQLDNH